MNFSTTPPYRPTMIRHRSKYADNSSRTSSESLDSDNGVKPTRSPNSTDVTRRSATGAAGGAAAGATRQATSGNGVPHSSQNLPRSEGVPHDEQARAPITAPHSGQNFAPARTDAPQAEHSPCTCRIPSILVDAVPPEGSTQTLPENSARQASPADLMPRCGLAWEWSSRQASTSPSLPADVALPGERCGFTWALPGRRLAGQQQVRAVR